MSRPTEWQPFDPKLAAIAKHRPDLPSLIATALARLSLPADQPDARVAAVRATFTSDKATHDGPALVAVVWVTGRIAATEWLRRAARMHRGEWPLAVMFEGGEAFFEGGETNAAAIEPDAAAMHQAWRRGVEVVPAAALPAGENLIDVARQRWKSAAKAGRRGQA